MKNRHLNEQVKEILRDTLALRARLTELKFRTSDETERDQLFAAQNALTQALNTIAKLNS